MTTPHTTASLQRLLDRTMLRRAVTAMIDGTGLKIRELKNELVIFNPHAPDKGRIHIEYANGYVSWEHTHWDHWGPLQGYPDQEDSRTPRVGLTQILTTLGATPALPPQPPSPSPRALGPNEGMAPVDEPAAR